MMSPSKSSDEVNTSGLLFLVAGGFLLIISGATGNVGWLERLVDFLSLLLIPAQLEVAQMLLTILWYVASLGGVAVLIGAYLIKKSRQSLGKFIVGLGAGVGVTNLALLLIPVYLSGGGNFQAWLLILSIASTTNGLGLLLTILGRLRV